MSELLPWGGQDSTEALGAVDDSTVICDATDALRSVIDANRASEQQVTVEYPYMPEQGEIRYVPADDAFMVRAKEFARLHSLDAAMPNCSVVVRDGVEVGIAANGSTYHEINGCERKRLGSKTGEDYDKCEGCSPKNHGEPKAIANALENVDAEVVNDAEIYLWGHWWCCESCWNAMLASGITKVNLLENSQVIFNQSHPDNSIGRQFEA